MKKEKFFKVLPKERLLLYFHSIYHRKKLELTITTEKEDIVLFDENLINNFCKCRMKHGDSDCKAARKNVINSI